MFRSTRYRQPECSRAKVTRRDVRHRRWLDGAIAGVLFVLTFAVRWPFTGESFWIDELHTSWCITGELSQVAERARMGNQQPLYFWCMWLWQSIVSPSSWPSYPAECLLRLSSVLCVSLSSVVLFRAVLAVGSSFIAATFAGLALALDRNAGFFGTELRPYAVVILCATFSLFFAALLLRDPRNQRLSSWIGLHASVLVAALMHITSLLTLAPLVVATTGWSLYRQQSNESINPDHQLTGRQKATAKWHLLFATGWLCVAVAFAFAQQDIWERRDAWSAFGQPKSLYVMWTLWPWLAWIVIPLLASILIRRLANSHRATTPIIASSWLGTTVLVFAATAGFILADVGGVPLWHRRYFIAGLPIGCFVLGTWISTLQAARSYEKLSIGLGASCLILLFWTQSSIQTEIPPRVASRYWIYRGEPWRESIAHFQSQSKTTYSSGKSIVHLWLDPDLIEQPWLAGEITDSPLREYLSLPIRGEYAVAAKDDSQTVVVHVLGAKQPHASWQNILREQIEREPSAMTPELEEDHWLLTRNLSQQAMEEENRTAGVDRAKAMQVRRFRNLTLFRWDVEPTR
ncbi:glycosyltransferase family 39 protein [Rhodopirellula halodulae]|uniref:glycosyltransferase family 39 protein n=1 Tax=Rhodopirellula halodulae TaxID=2894198 RepID=UPI001E302CFE|nr:glycosyltransferase family 39 protein [Rhodopirellula sp. JC737]MCC9656587.1 glycosyltransferase family 39 protein [Rhodopirellula sp. JC737]